MLLQSLYRHLYKLYCLDLERRKFLLELLLHSLFDGSGHYLGKLMFSLIIYAVG